MEHEYKCPQKQTYFDLNVEAQIASLSKIHEIDSAIEKFLSNDAQSEDVENLRILFRKICIPYLAKEGSKFIYKPFVGNLDGRRSAIPEDLAQEELEFLDRLVDDIQNLTLKARIADIIWFLKFGPNKLIRAKQVVDTWLAIDITKDNFLDFTEEIERAISIAVSIKYNFDGIKEFKKKLIKIAEEGPYTDIGIPYRIHLLLTNTIGLTKDEQEEFFKLASEKLTKADGGKKYWSTDIGYLELMQSCLEKIEDKERILQNLLAIAQRYEEEAIMNENASEFMKSNYFYELAVKAYLDIPKSRRAEHKTDEKITALKSKKQVIGVAVTETLQEFRYEIKIPEKAISDAVERVSNRTFPNVLLYYKSLLNGFPNLDEIEKQTKTNIQNSILSHIIPRSGINSMGRTTNKQDAVDLNNPEIPNYEKVETYTNYLKFYYIPILLEALNVITNEHHITLADLIALCRYSTCIARERVISWANGLYYGFAGDYSAAAHLLIPQIEHMIRMKLLEAGVNTAVLESDGVENEKSLSTLLDYPEIDTIFEKPFVFELKALLGSAPNMNLRNNVAHGLIDDNNFDGGFFYLWVFALRMILDSIPIESKRNNS